MARTARDSDGRFSSVAGGAAATVDDLAGATVVDPVTIADAGGAGDGDGDGNRSKNNAPRGSSHWNWKGGKSAKGGNDTGGGASAKKSTRLDLSGFAASLLFAHNLLATFTQTPEFRLEQKEADELTAAAAKVASHYDIETTQKTMDIVNLGTCMAAIYGSRLVAINIRKSRERTARAGGVVITPAEANGAGLTAGVVYPGVGVQ